MSTPMRGAARRPPWRSVALFVTALTLSVAALPQLAAAQEQDELEQDEAPLGPVTLDDSSVQLRVTHLTGVLGPGSVEPSDTPGTLERYPSDLELRVLVENDGELDLDALRLVIEIHPPANSRGQLRRALEGGLTTAPVYIHSPEIRAGGQLGVGELAGIEDTFTAEEVSWADDPGGVHPVSISVTRGTHVLDELVTAVVWLGEPPREPLLTTAVWPIDSQPWRTVGGAYPEGSDRDLHPGDRLDTLIATLERSPTAPVTLAPAAHLLEDLSDRADGYTELERQEDGGIEARAAAADEPGASLATTALQRLRELAQVQPHPPVSSAYANADLAALLAGGTELRELAAVAAVDGRRRVQLQLGVEPDAATHLAGHRIDEPVLDLLSGEAVLLPSDATDLPPLGADPDLGEPVRTLTAPSGRLLTALVADPYLEESLPLDDAEGGPLVAAQRPLAESAMAYLTAPGTPDRGLVLLPPRTWSPSAAAAAALLDGLEAATWLHLGPPSRLTTDARRSTTPIGLSPPEDGPFEPAMSDALATASQQLAIAAASTYEGTSRLGGRPTAQLREDLLRATSRWYRGSPSAEAEAAALLRDVQSRIDAAFGEVEVASGSVTLTSDTGQIPVTLQRTRGVPVEVTVTIDSQGRLLWPEGRTSETLLLEEDGSQTVSFPTRALSTGTFPVTVRVTDPSGTHEFVRSSLSVRSTAISGPALGGIAGVVVLLLLVGALRRRDRSPKLRLIDHPDGEIERPAPEPADR